MTGRKKDRFFVDMADDHPLNKRSGLERRQNSREGFTYISTVGWICRREQFRRKAEEGADKPSSNTS